MNKNNNNKLLIVSNNSKELDIDNNKEEIIINIYGNSKEKIEGKSFKITEENRIMYKIFSNFFEELKDEYNAFKDFHDFYFSNQPLYDEKHNWFSFYSGNNMFRIIFRHTYSSCSFVSILLPDIFAFVCKVF